MEPNKNIIPKLTLVGAGPGDADLISLKGARAIAEADVILYDALVNKEVLKYATPSSIKIFVGKRKNKHTFTQEEINRKIVEMALAYSHVVRLKGGDPFVFGRGHEEIEFAECFNIKIEAIPGITSAIAVPELQGIPLTRRGISESFFVTTGTTASGDVSDDLYQVAKSNATVVVLMGMHRLGQILDVFRAEGKCGIPVAVIQNGSMLDERIGLGTMETIEEIVKKKSLESPAIIIIGEVVRLHKNFPEEKENFLKVKNNNVKPKNIV